MSSIERGTPGEVYNIGGGNEVRNVDLTHTLAAAHRTAVFVDSAGARSPWS